MLVHTISFRFRLCMLPKEISKNVQPWECKECVHTLNKYVYWELKNNLIFYPDRTDINILFAVLKRKFFLNTKE